MAVGIGGVGGCGGKQVMGGAGWVTAVGGRRRWLAALWHERFAVRVRWARQVLGLRDESASTGEATFRVMRSK